MPTAKPKPPPLLSAGFRRKMWLEEEMFVGASGAGLQTYWVSLVRCGRFEVWDAVSGGQISRNLKYFRCF
jgi:hypothetical protein